MAQQQRSPRQARRVPPRVPRLKRRLIKRGKATKRNIVIFLGTMAAMVVLVYFVSSLYTYFTE